MRPQSEFRRLHAGAKEVVAKGNDKWQVHFSGPGSYEHSFSYLLDPNETLSSIVDRWSDRESVAGLDIMGSGAVFHGLHLQHGLGMALTDARPATMQAAHGDAVGVVDGNILNLETWKRAEQWIQSRGLEDPHFRLVLFRPVGGVNYIPNDPVTLYTLLQRAWALMSKKDAELFAVVPHDVENLVEAWVEQLNATNGIHARIQTNHDIAIRTGGVMTMDSPTAAIRMTKSEGAPDELPQTLYDARTRFSGDRMRYYPKKS